MGVLRLLTKAIEELERCAYCPCADEAKRHIYEAVSQLKNYINLVNELYIYIIKFSALLFRELELPREIRINISESELDEVRELMGFLLINGYRLKFRNSNELHLFRDDLENN